MKRSGAALSPDGKGIGKKGLRRVKKKRKRYRRGGNPSVGV